MCEKLNIGGINGRAAIFAAFYLILLGTYLLAYINVYRAQLGR